MNLTAQENDFVIFHVQSHVAILYCPKRKYLNAESIVIQLFVHRSIFMAKL